MARRSPSLNALRAFEAAARHLSFTRAAEELHVTQAAISHQVKALEDSLDTRLFRRLNRAILLTDAGKAYLAPIRDALDTITVATQRLQQREVSGPLRVSVLPSFASKWLLPRLSLFRERHAQIDVLVSARAELVDFSRDEVDVALRYGTGEYPGLVTDYLMSDEVFPVCSPALLAGEPPLAVPSDLRHHTLLHGAATYGKLHYEDWEWWLDKVAIQGVDTERGPGFSDAALMLQAAIEGQGVALGRRTLCADDLAARRLVKPFDIVFKARHSYYLVAPPATAEQSKVRLFREWLLEETAAEREG